MSVGPTVIDRAFQLARAGPYSTIEAVSRQLIGEGYEQVGAHLSGPTIRRTLYRIMRARTASEKPAE